MALNKPKFSPAAIEKIKSILDTNPDILMMFGMDPEEARAEIQKIEENKSKGTPSKEDKQA